MIRKKLAIFLSNNEFSRYAYEKLKKEKEVLPVSFSNLDFTDASIISKGDIYSFFNLLEKEKIEEFVFIGKVEPSEIFKEDLHISGKNFLEKIKGWRGEEILGEIVKKIEEMGVRIVPLTEIFKDEMTERKVYTERKLNEKEKEDIKTGFEIGKILVKYRIGQSLSIKNGMVIAVEGIEGTDKMIERTGEYVHNFILVKIAGEKKDIRFDLPVIGPGTVKTMAKAGGRVIAVESGKTIIFDKEKVINLCNKNRMTFIGF